MAVEAHGGRIQVGSELGQGARFYFDVPLISSGAARIPSREGDVDRSRIAREELAAGDLIRIQPLAEELARLEVYETSDIEEILEGLPAGRSEAVEAWLQQLRRAIHALDEAGYRELVSRARG